MLQNSKLLNLYKRISLLKNYKPSKTVNSLFAELVKVALNDRDFNVLDSNKLKKLQRICSLSEFELEKNWANKIIKSSNAFLTLDHFPYVDNYRKLTKMEWYSLLSCSKHGDHNVLFVGGGPLPMTAIILASEYNKKVTILEKDTEAVEISKKLIKHLNLHNMINIIKSDASEFVNYRKFSVIIVAALAGVDKKIKKEILSRIHEQAKISTHVLARSSWGMREILYRPIDKDVFKLFKTEIEVRPHNDIVNSVIIFTI